MSTFGGISRASTALWAAQRGLDVSGQNIANVNTAGYTRQRVEQQSVNGAVTPAIHSVGDGIGSGVDSDAVIRIRDAFLEARAHTEAAATARLTVQSDALSQIEAAYREPGDTGIQKMMAEMWAGWSDVSNNPTELAARSQVLERLETLTSGIRTTAASLDQQWTDTRASLGSLVDDANATITSIAKLNGQISLATQSGMPANELSDQRDVLVQTLAWQIGATSSPAQDGSVTVSVGGTTLVTGTSSTGLRLSGAEGLADVGTKPPRLLTAPGGTALAVDGTAGGQLGVLSRTLPDSRAALDAIASGLARTLNDAHDDGIDLDGAAGGPLLGNGAGSGPVDTGLVDAANITVRVTDPRRVAASTAGPAGAATVNGDNADALFSLSLDPKGVDAGYRELIVRLGVSSAVATRDLEVQSVISDRVDAAREGVSGVSLDEEMTNMLSYQHAYGAAARLLTAIDEALNTLINGTGLVGRS